MDDPLDRRAKAGAERRLAVAAKGDMTQLEQLVAQGPVGVPGANRAGTDEQEGPLQLLRHDIDIQLPFRGRRPVIHLAIDAIEVAAFVRTHVDADRQAPRARRDDRIDEAIVQKIAGAAESGRSRNGRQTRANSIGNVLADMVLLQLLHLARRRSCHHASLS